MKGNKIFNIEHINADVFSVLQLTTKIGWKETRELSILRILYLSSLLYTFRYPTKNNPFEDDYEFTVDYSRGPFNDKIVNNSITWLLVNEIIRQNDDSKSYSLLERKIPYLEQIPNYVLKKDWIEVIVYILGIYGEESIYDFIFRDPEYSDNVARQSTKTLNISESNKTIEKLNEFQRAFIKVLGDKAKELTDKDYLEMYFEYVFSKYLKGEK